MWWRLLGYVGYVRGFWCPLLRPVGIRAEGSFLGRLSLALVTRRLLVVVRVSLAGCSPALLRGVQWCLCTLSALLR